MDAVEKEYEAKINQAATQGKNDLALELTFGLAEYQQFLQDKSY